MIVANNFIFIHKGKTGGDKFYELMNTHKVFRDSIMHQDYICGKDGRNSNSLKHNSLWWLYQQHYNIDAMKFVMGFRQLPSWLLSVTNHHFYDKYVDNPVAVRRINEQLNQGLIIKNKHNSDRLDIYNDWNWIYADNSWQDLIRLASPPTLIRQEYLLKDFNQKIAIPYYNIELTNDYNNLINAFDKTDSPFRVNDMETIYKNNPLWTKLEKELYNDKHSYC